MVQRYHAEIISEHDEGTVVLADDYEDLATRLREVEAERDELRKAADGLERVARAYRKERDELAARLRAVDAGVAWRGDSIVNRDIQRLRDIISGPVPPCPTCEYTRESIESLFRRTSYHPLKDDVLAILAQHEGSK